ncbi:uncharacterized protein BDZ99DRAFT_500940 [Mytilinidion resinicola]|uniref:Bromodomain associated domain-containing protein n=1 Tax=Mytilinidion resinicola TaxID=574789 RepID=A0A6A6YDK0_9PEZI|nr:uncharacterized protein BDZ99DRAFT_500940 [Mytilinidion resinicola]KAF2806902.1 hypothetical protein BDZ99DRAFT_500940 [Mytilinidion resinicola]
MSSNTLHNSLLRPAILHILRAAGFHAAKPSVLDTLTDITTRYILLLASRTAENAVANHNTPEPDITDVRMALQDCGLLVPSLTPGEEAWKEMLRKPLAEYPERNGLREKERIKRDEEDTQDVKAFLDWIEGEQNREIQRIAGLGAPPPAAITTTADLDSKEMEDYLTSLMKKHSKTGVESRYQGTVLGQPSELKPVKIEGGPVESIEEWRLRTQQRAAKPDLSNDMKGKAVDSVETNGHLMEE